MLEFEYTFDENEHPDDLRVELVLRNFMHDIADFARDSFYKHVPQGDSLRTLESVEEGRVNKTPYGFEVEIGITPIEEVEEGESPYYPLFVHEGTGLFSDDPHWIVPTHGNVMVFERGGDVIFTRQTTGQPAQPYLDTVEEETHVYIELKKQEVARLIQQLM
jgi:hypothetical protein